MKPVLHHYWGSNFAEKVRLMFGLKGLAWDSVIIPEIMPKPELVALTGGYSKTPVLQLGADIYCDTRRIADALETFAPMPSLFPNGARDVIDEIQCWADGPFAVAAARYLMGRAHDRWPMEFHVDRAALWGVPVDLDRMAHSAGRYREQLLGFLQRIARMLQDGQAFLAGDAASLADCACAHVVWFLHLGGAATTDVLTPFPTVMAWYARTSRLGHGLPANFSAVDALVLAQATAPRSAVCIDPESAHGYTEGEAVSVIAERAGREPVVGRLHRLTSQEIAVRVKGARVGEVVVHFPRLGYVLSRVQ